MDKKVYFRGKLGCGWYNFTEFLAWLLTYERTPKGVTYDRHIPYGEEKRQYINIFSRDDLADVQKPLFIYVHGGGWISGITDMRNAYVHNFARAGYFTASLSYSYAPDKVFPSQIQEICTAVDKVLDIAEGKNVDTTKIVLSGESAGVYYIFMLAALVADHSLADRLGIEFKHINDFKISAMVAHSGAVKLDKLLDKNCPQSGFPDIKMMTCSFLGKPNAEAVKWLKTEEGKLSIPIVNADFPPTFFATGEKDRLRFESYDIIKEYEALNIPYDRFEGTGAMGAHAWTIVTKLKQGKECFDKTSAFLQKIGIEI